MKLLQVQKTAKRTKSFFYQPINTPFPKITSLNHKSTFNFDTTSSSEINHRIRQSHELLEIGQQIPPKIISSLSISPSKSLISPDRYRKKSCGEIIKINKSFNRTETDYHHNFVGIKYEQKIKQQIKFFKYHSFGSKYERARKEHLKIASKLEERTLQIQQNSQSIPGKLKLTEEDDSPIKLIKQKRRCRAKIILNSKFICPKGCIIDEKEGRGEKIDELSPWEGSTLCYWVGKK